MGSAAFVLAGDFGNLTRSEAREAVANRRDWAVDEAATRPVPPDQPHQESAPTPSRSATDAPRRQPVVNDHLFSQTGGRRSTLSGFKKARALTQLYREVRRNTGTGTSARSAENEARPRPAQVGLDGIGDKPLQNVAPPPAVTRLEARPPETSPPSDLRMSFRLLSSWVHDVDAVVREGLDAAADETGQPTVLADPREAVSDLRTAASTESRREPIPLDLAASFGRGTLRSSKCRLPLPSSASGPPPRGPRLGARQGQLCEVRLPGILGPSESLGLGKDPIGTRPRARSERETPCGPARWWHESRISRAGCKRRSCPGGTAVRASSPQSDLPSLVEAARDRDRRYRMPQGEWARSVGGLPHLGGD
jgi:hypothetical protein